MLDHDSAHAVFQRLIAGEVLGEGELERALAHSAECEECRARFDLGWTAACAEVEEDLPAAAQVVRERQELAGQYPALARHLEECDRCRIVLAELVSEPEQLSTEMAEPPVDPAELFERVLPTGLADPEAIVRERAAEQLGELDRLGAKPLAALARAAAEDPDEDVRAAASRALSALGVTELVGTAVTGEEALAFTGTEGISGELTEYEQELRLSLKGLPPKFEHAKLLVAIPRVLEGEVSSIEWPGEPGLVPAEETVQAGSLEMTLGRVPEGTPAEKRKLFERMYLLNPKARRERKRRKR
ncbi:MAG: HEAT repeat domain-containing protein [Gaiellaceae bacterium]